MAQQRTTRVKSSTQRPKSRYVQGGLTDVHPNRTGWWERKPFEFRDDDYIITVNSAEQGRPDLISYRVYGTTEYTWLILQYNNIVDIQEEIITGAELRLPTERRVTLDIMTQQTGGNRVK